MVNRPEYIIVGRFGRVYGVSGEIHIIPLTDNPERFQSKKPLWLKTEDGWKELKIQSLKTVSRKPVVKVAGLNTQDDVRVLTNEFIYIKSSDLDILPDGNYYRFDLIDCRVYDSDHEELGRVVDLEAYPANDMLIIESADGKKHLLPMIKRFVKEIDLEKMQIIVDLPAGMFD